MYSINEIEELKKNGVQIDLIDRRQFVIMNKPYYRENFNQILLPCGLYLSYHNELLVSKYGENILLGLAFSCEKEKIDLTNSVADRLHLAGRWILISPTELYLDACGSLGCFYGYDATNGIVLSSSLRIIQEILGSKWVADYHIKYNDGLPYMDYYPIPFTPYSGVNKMLPTQYFELKTLTIKQENEFWYDQYAALTVDELYFSLKEKLIQVFHSIRAKYNGNIWVPLTAGVDSRSCLALAKKAGLDFGAYTSLRNNINRWDCKAPTILCKRLGIDHFYMDDRGARSSERELIYDFHCGGKVSVGTDRNQFIANNDVPNSTNSIVLWGTAWELYGRNFWGTFELGKNNEERLAAWNTYCKGAINKSNIHLKSLGHWMDYIELNPMKTMDWRQRMYYEQRIGSWLSGAFQAIDLFDSVRIAPVNCYDIFGILFNLVDRTFSKDSRSDKRFQKWLINEYIPEVRDIPYEEKVSIVTKIFRKVKKKVGRNYNNIV